MSEAIQALNLEELESLARELLPQMAYDYYASGADDEITLREKTAKGCVNRHSSNCC
ncbi:MAG: hypothetical protein JO279_07045 [Verrucomicrobia bacterium]|nr:hypothetical protein [Verrucomicrobiota bacterium]